MQALPPTTTPRDSLAHAHQRRASTGQRALHATFALLTSVLTGCAASGAQRSVVNVATHDLGCDRVDVAEISQNRYAAYGCGRGAVYAQLCNEGDCRWGRLRHGHESSIAAASQPAVAESRELLQAPAAAPREVLPAPAPEQREVIKAPPPAASAPGADGASPLQPGAAAAAAPAPVALSDGELSEPYQTEVPAQPVAQQTTVAPPVPLIETRPPPPAYNHVWISGYWWWGTGARWVWAPGYWCPPYYGYSYIPGSWYWYGGYWNYGPGGWARPGTTIIINRNFPPRPSNVAVTRAFTPHRVVRSDATSGAHRVVGQAPSGYQPRSSPLMAPARVSGTGASSSRGGAYNGGKSRFGADGVGRVVTPGSAARPRSDFSSRGYAPSGSYGGGGRDFARPSAGSSRSSFGSERSFSSGSSGGSRSFGGGGGGRSFSGGGGGRSFGGGGMSPARVSPGGGGGGGGGRSGGGGRR